MDGLFVKGVAAICTVCTSRRRALKTLATFLTCFALAAVTFADEKPAQKDESKKATDQVQLRGKLRHPVYALGGETTGTVIETEKGAYELDLAGKNDLKKIAESLNEKKVAVRGTLTVRKGVEVEERRIVTVAELKAAPKK